MDALQKVISNFVSKHNLQCSLHDRVLDLTSEIGEVAKEILKSTNYGKNEFTPSSDWEEELGDVLFSLICLANITNTNLNESLKKVLAKYEKRLILKGNAGS